MVVKRIGNLWHIFITKLCQISARCEYVSLKQTWLKFELECEFLLLNALENVVYDKSVILFRPRWLSLVAPEVVLMPGCGADNDDTNCHHDDFRDFSEW